MEVSEFSPPKKDGTSQLRRGKTTRRHHAGLSFSGQMNGGKEYEKMGTMKSLIAYFSREGNNYVSGRIVNLPVGNTEVAANLIRKLTGGDTFRIHTVKDYPADYNETTAVAKQELRENTRPELSGHVDNMDEYNLIFLGYPNWWGTMPMGVFTFLEEHDFSGKTIIPFCTNEGSGMGRSESDIKQICPDAKVLKGLSIKGGGVLGAENDISAWLRKSGVMDQKEG
jgi:flavodoxin